MKDQRATKERLVWAYRRMLERVWDYLHTLDEKTSPLVKKAIDKANTAAVELNELSKEESQKIANYLQRDLQAAVEYVDKTGKALKDWLAFDWLLIEDRLWQLFSTVADKSYLDLQRFKQQFSSDSEYHAHEVVGMGTLKCSNCGELQQCYTVHEITPCPKCLHKTFTRLDM